MLTAKIKLKCDHLHREKKIKVNYHIWLCRQSKQHKTTGFMRDDSKMQEKNLPSIPEELMLCFHLTITQQDHHITWLLNEGKQRNANNLILKRERERGW